MQADQGQAGGGAQLTVRVEAALTGPAEHRRKARALFEEMGWEVQGAAVTGQERLIVPHSVPLNSWSSLRGRLRS